MRRGGKKTNQKNKRKKKGKTRKRPQSLRNGRASPEPGCPRRDAQGSAIAGPASWTPPSALGTAGTGTPPAHGRSPSAAPRRPQGLGAPRGSRIAARPHRSGPAPAARGRTQGGRFAAGRSAGSCRRLRLAGMRQPAAAGASPARGARRGGCPGRTGLRRRSRLASPPSGGAPAARHGRRQPRRSCTRPPLPVRRGAFGRPQRLSHGHRGEREKAANLKNRKGKGKEKKSKKTRARAGAGARRWRSGAVAAAAPRAALSGTAAARPGPALCSPFSRARPRRPRPPPLARPRRARRPHWPPPPPPRQCARPGRGDLTPSAPPSRVRLRALPRGSREGRAASCPPRQLRGTGENRAPEQPLSISAPVTRPTLTQKLRVKCTYR